MQDEEKKFFTFLSLSFPHLRFRSSPPSLLLLLLFIQKANDGVCAAALGGDGVCEIALCGAGGQREAAAGETRGKTRRKRAASGGGERQRTEKSKGERIARPQRRERERERKAEEDQEQRRCTHTHTHTQHSLTRDPASKPAFRRRCLQASRAAARRGAPPLPSARPRTFRWGRSELRGGSRDCRCSPAGLFGPGPSRPPAGRAFETALALPESVREAGRRALLEVQVKGSQKIMPLHQRRAGADTGRIKPPQHSPTAPTPWEVAHRTRGQKVSPGHTPCSCARQAHARSAAAGTARLPALATPSPRFAASAVDPHFFFTQERQTFKTTTPEETLSQIRAWLDARPR